MNKHDKDFYDVLIADDSESDRLLLRTAFRHATRLKIAAEVPDGADAISYLRGHEEFADRKKFPLPDLLLLDLRMPVKDGFEVLESLQEQPCEGLTVVVLTDSMRAEDIKRALDLGADLFQVKPGAHAELTGMVLALEDYLVRGRGRARDSSRSRTARSLA